ncbi:MAG: HAD family hydrolase [Anaerolineales bacterium]
MPIKAVIFDLGGVLVRTEDQQPRRALAERLDISRQQMYYLIFDSPSAQQASQGTITVAEHWEAVRQAMGLSDEEFQRVPQEFWAGDRLDNELIAYIRSLHPRYRTALLSNAWDDLRSYLEERWQIADAFDEIIISAEVGITKPDPRIYRLALERLDIMPQEAVFVDDFEENIHAAQALGLHAIHFRDRQQALSELDGLLDSRL